MGIFVSGSFTSDKMGFDKNFGVNFNSPIVKRIVERYQPKRIYRSSNETQIKMNKTRKMKFNKTLLNETNSVKNKMKKKNFKKEIVERPLTQREKLRQEIREMLREKSRPRGR